MLLIKLLELTYYLIKVISRQITVFQFVIKNVIKKLYFNKYTGFCVCLYRASRKFSGRFWKIKINIGEKKLPENFVQSFFSTC